MGLRGENQFTDKQEPDHTILLKMAIKINDDIERHYVKGRTVWRRALSELSNTKMVWRLKKILITDVLFHLSALPNLVATHLQLVY